MLGHRVGEVAVAGRDVGDGREGEAQRAQLPYQQQPFPCPVRIAAVAARAAGGGQQAEVGVVATVFTGSPVRAANSPIDQVGSLTSP
ncbi:hypothetical protein MUU72_04695 [Streptomyces sp. RS10V-4]|nr:hypothetical protein [Streptomyces rhizoryzae]MCK7622420.1 hypothetical protein [Streptomyces rhizoryzae]